MYSVLVMTTAHCAHLYNAAYSVYFSNVFGIEQAQSQLS